MKELKYRSTHNNKIFSLKLGKTYQITDQWKKKNTCLFIKTTAKGFNLLNLRNARCLSQKTFYQENSKNKKIGRNQITFDINLPDYVEKIEELNQQEIKAVRFFNGISFYAPNKTIKQEAKEELEREIEEEKRAIEENTFNNAIDGMEI